MTVIRKSALVAMLIVTSAPYAAAQAAPGACAIDDGKPGQVKDARNAIVKAELIGKPEDKIKAFAEAIGKLTNPKDEAKVVAANPTGRQMVLGRALANIAAQPNQPTVVTRGSIGYGSSPEAQIDIVAAADSAFDAVEASNAACHADLEENRRRIYAPMVNSAVNLYNDRKVDSAEALVRKALTVYDDYKLAYIAYNILGNIQQTKSDMPGAIGSFRKMAALMKGDTALVDERKNTMVMVSQLMMQEGENLEGDKKAAAMKEVVAYMENEYLKEYPGDVKGQAAVARAQILSGDKEAATKLFTDMSSNPDKYTDTQLFEAGVGAARAEQAPAATALFEAGLKKNPYSRDGLFNLAATLSTSEAWDKLPAVMNRLIEVDPENPDNYRIWALFYQARAKQLKPLAERKPATDPNVVAFNATNDSLLKYFKRFNEAPVKVQFSLFSHDGAKHVLSGLVENNGDAAKAFTLKFDFLDNTGKTVTSKEVAVPEIPAKGSKSFRLEVEGAGIVAFKYAPLSGM
jgi:tetratricopeptide (TPR) repeat protein